MAAAATVFLLSAASLPDAARAQMWAIRNVTRIYFGSAGDQKVPADYDGDGSAEAAVFRGGSNLWSIRDFTRLYFGGSADTGVPSDYGGDGGDDVAIFRPSAGLWAIRNLTRLNFGGSADLPVSSLGYGDFNGDGTSDIAVFRPGTVLWAVRNITRVYFGASSDTPAGGDFNGDGTTDIAVFRGNAGLWAIRGISRIYFGQSTDRAAGGDYDGDGTADIAVFRGNAGLWAIRDISRIYFGQSTDQPLPRDYNGDGADDPTVFRSISAAPSPSPSASPSPVPFPSPSPADSLIYRIQHDGLTGTVTVSGIVSLVYPDMGFFLADDSGPEHGIYINQSTYGPEIGNSVTITGTVASAQGQTQIASLSSYAVNSSGNTPHPPVAVTTGLVLEERYEGSLVRIEDIQVSNQHTGSGKWQVQPIGGGTAATLDDELDYNYFPKNGDQFTSLIGVVERDTSQSPNQWLQPRFTADLGADKTVIPHYALRGTVVTMDDARNVYDDYYIEVKGDLIDGVTAGAPPGVDIIEVDGLIFPGLINTHDHPSKGLWDTIPLPYLGTYTCLNDWAGSDADPATKAVYNDFQWQSEGEMFPSLNATYSIGKLTEVRMASSGCTVTQGQVNSTAHYRDEVAKLGVGIINGERFPGRVDQQIFPVALGSAYWTNDHNKAVKGKLHRYFIHLAQSTVGGCEAYEFNWWRAQSAFDGRDTIIHGTSLDAADFALFSHADGRQTVLSWAAYCNELYYGAQPNIRAALDAGALVAIGTDATPWSWANLLAELNFCKYISDQKAWNIQSLEFAEMVTRNAAAGFGQLDRMGTIEEGKLANLMVIGDGTGDPYDDLLTVAGGGSSYNYQCGPKDVKLTVVSGRPIYGDPDLLTVANFPSTYGGYIEDLTICGTPKKVTIARNNYAGTAGVGDLFWTFYLDLWRRYNESGKYPCHFVSVDPAGGLPSTPSPKAADYRTPTPPPPPLTDAERYADDANLRFVP